MSVALAILGVLGLLLGVGGAFGGGSETVIQQVVWVNVGVIGAVLLGAGAIVDAVRGMPRRQFDFDADRAKAARKEAELRAREMARAGELQTGHPLARGGEVETAHPLAQSGEIEREH